MAYSVCSHVCRICFINCFGKTPQSLNEMFRSQSQRSNQKTRAHEVLFKQTQICVHVGFSKAFSQRQIPKPRVVCSLMNGVSTQSIFRHTPLPYQDLHTLLVCLEAQIIISWIDLSMCDMLHIHTSVAFSSPSDEQPKRCRISLVYLTLPYTVDLRITIMCLSST